MTSTAVNAVDPSLRVTISELARIKGVDKAWISRRVAKWEADRLITTWRGERGSKLVNRAEYDRLAQQTGDLVKEQAAETVRETSATDAPPAELPLAERGKFAGAKADQAVYDAELKKLELADRRRLVVPIVKVVEAMQTLAGEIVQLIDRLPLRAGEMAAAVAKDGEIGARAIYKTDAFKLREGIAFAFKKLEAEGLAEEAAGPIDVDVSEDAA